MASIKTIFFFIFAVIMSLSSASAVEEDKGNMLRVSARKRPDKEKA
jgi:hypothetical protein